MNQEKKIALLVTLVFGLGILSGLVIGSNRSNPQHIKAEYYLELKPDGSAIIEDCGGNTIVCPIDSISAVIIKDNL